LRTLSAPQTPRPESEKLVKLKIIQQQVGHEHASTTSIYTCVSSDFRVKTLRSALDATVTAAMGKHPAVGPGEPRQAAPGSRQAVGDQARDAR
jgi:hypothetical protein